MSARLLAIALCFPPSPASPNAERPMEFSLRCDPNGCFVRAEGRIEKDSVDHYERIQPFFPELPVVLNSGGGSLPGGLRLGRKFREHRATTLIGVFDEEKEAWIFYEGSNQGRCLSACAYAFLGGSVRSWNPFGVRADLPVASNGAPQYFKLGFHAAALPGQVDTPGAGGLLYGQRLSSEILSYLLDMGIDGQILVEAGKKVGDEFFFPTHSQMIEYNLFTVSDFGGMTIAPGLFGNQQAVLHRLGAPVGYDGYINQISFFCGRGRVHIELFVNQSPIWRHIKIPSGISAEFYESALLYEVTQEGRHHIPKNSVTYFLREGFTIELDEIDINWIKRSKEPIITILMSEDFQHRIDLSVRLQFDFQDKAILSSVFEACHGD